jgi:hypothetical protein
MALDTVGAGCNSQKAGVNGQSSEAKKLLDAEAELKRGQFLQAEKMLTPPVSPAAAFFVVLSELDLGQKPDFRLISTLTFEKRGYVLGLLALFMPQTALDYLHTRGQLEPGEVQAAVTALKIQNQSAEEIEKQGEAWIYPTSKFEKDLSGAHLPDLKESELKLKEDVRVFVSTTQRLRRELKSAIAALPPKDQLRILAEDRALEKKTGLFLRDLPLPPGPSKQKLPEYKKGMARIAQEYFDREKELSEMEASIQQHLSSSSKLDDVPTLPNMKQWAWPLAFVSGEGYFAPIEKTFDEKNYLGALILADLLRSELFKTEADYYTIRSGFLLMQAGQSSDSVPLRRYVQNELIQTQQDAILKQWKSLVQQK